MGLDEPRITQVQIKGMNLKSMFDKSFLKFLEKEFENLKFGSIRLYESRPGENEEEEKKKRESIFIAHLNPEHEKDNILIIDADTPETIDKMLSVLREYDKGC